MKKFFSICVVLLMIAMLSAMVTSCSCGEPAVIVNSEGEVYYNNLDTIVTYKLDGQNVNAQVDNNKSLVFQGIFYNMTEIDDAPDCKFSKKFMITFDEDKYYIDQNGGQYIKHKGKYYQTPVSERMIINDIFEEYGAMNIYEKEKY